MSADPADIAALRADGDLVAYLRSLTGRPAPAMPRAPEPEIPRPGPGAWPISGPLPRPRFPAAEVDRAVAEYRAWELDGRPGCDTTCECPNCTPEEAS